MKLIFAILLVIAPPAYAGSTFSVKAFDAVTAGVDHTSSTIDIGLNKYMSFQCFWTGITGTINGVVNLQASNDDGTTFTDKTSATFTMSGASGNQDVSLVNATEQKYHLVYTAGTVTGGALTCWVVAK